jgi:hypothetical protein
MDLNFFGGSPNSAKKQAEENAFKIDYTFWFNLIFATITTVLVYFNIKKKKMEGNWRGFNLTNVGFKRMVVYLFALILLI